MANKKITDLDPAGAISGANQVELEQSGVSKRATVQDIVETIAQPLVDAEQAARIAADATEATARAAADTTLANDLDAETNARVTADTTEAATRAAADTAEATARAAADTALDGRLDTLEARNESIIVACSDETTAITAAADKTKIRAPYAFNLYAVRASLSTAQTSGNIVTVNVKVGGVSVFSTKVTIDNTEKTSTTATTPSVLTSTPLAIADDAEITFDVDQIGDGTAKGLKVALIGRQG